MRYIIFDEFKKEWPDRRQYIFDTTNLWCFKKEAYTYIELTSIPTNTPDILFLIGHNNSVYNYLKENSATIHESMIVIISCQRKYDFKSLIPGKKVLICNQSSEKTADMFYHKQFDFYFDATESELLFYNCPEKDIDKRLKLCFSVL